MNINTYMDGNGRKYTVTNEVTRENTSQNTSQNTKERPSRNEDTTELSKKHGYTGVDVNVLLGHWPFRKIRKHTFDDLRQVHQQNNISGGYVASLNSIFYNDPFEGDKELHEIIRNTEYKHILTVNPMLPGWEHDIREGLRLFHIHGVRIYPTYHEYDINAEAVAQLCVVLKEHGLPLFVSKRLEDERLDYLYRPKNLPVAELKSFVLRHPDLDIILLNIRFGELISMGEGIGQLPRLYFDTSGFKDKDLVSQDLHDRAMTEKILFGSLHPLQCLKSSHCLIDMAEIDESIKEHIFSKNSEFLRSTLKEARS